MATVSPVFRCIGTVHSVEERHVKALDAKPAQYDDAGKFIKRAQEARDAYDVYDVMLHTKDGGYALVLLRADGLAHLGGAIPSRGDEVDWPVRHYVSWQGPENRRYTVVGTSVAGDVLAAEAADRNKSGARVASVG